MPCDECGSEYPFGFGKKGVCIECLEELDEYDSPSYWGVL